jgi:hypothetical protein
VGGWPQTAADCCGSGGVREQTAADLEVRLANPDLSYLKSQIRGILVFEKPNTWDSRI